MSNVVTDKFVYDTANEQTVLKAAIADKATRKSLVRTLSPSEFLAPVHRPIWKAMISLVNKGLDFDQATFRELLKVEGLSTAEFSYIDELTTVAHVTKNLPFHIETMGWDATRARALETTIPSLLEQIRDPAAPPQDVSSAARSVSKSLESKGGRRHLRRPVEHHRSYMAEVAARRAERNVYPIGKPAFDANLTEGFMPGKTTVIAGLPGAGKSTFTLALCVLLAKMGRKVTYCAWEMSPSSATDVLCSHMLKIDLRRIVQGDLTDKETHRLGQCVMWITKRITFISNPFFDFARSDDKRSKPSNDKNIDILEGYIADAGASVWVYDLWERMLVDTRPSEVTRALVRMQYIHEEYQIHGIILNQINLKDVERRIDRRPTRDAIKGTGAYVEIADMIYGIHREAQFKAVPDTTIETICLKQRKGKANWCIQWKWDGATCQVSDPKEVSFDPGLESQGEAGDVGIKNLKDIKIGKKRRPGRDG